MAVVLGLLLKTDSAAMLAVFQIPRRSSTQREALSEAAKPDLSRARIGIEPRRSYFGARPLPQQNGPNIRLPGPSIRALGYAPEHESYHTGYDGITPQ
jgi:hypothetical protein